MKVDNIGKLKSIQTKHGLENKEVNVGKRQKKTSTNLPEQAQIEDKGHLYDKVTIDDLKKISERSYEHLKQMIQDMITKQGKTTSLLGSNSMVTIDAATRAEASKLVDTDGPLGVEAVSDNIVNFAKAISGGDKDKLDTLKAAINKGFQAAQKTLGSLPPISQQTYDRIMEKLDTWENE